MAKGPSLTERAGAFFREHSLSSSRKIDVYLSEHMYDLIDKHSLATRSDLADIDKHMGALETRVDDLDIWRTDFEKREKAAIHKVELLEKKYAIKG